MQFLNKCCRRLRVELHYTKLCFSHKDWRAFTYTPWLPSKWHFQLLYLMYRWILTLYFFGWLVQAGIQEKHFFFIYFTNWTFLAFNLYLTWSTTIVTFHYISLHVCCKSSRYSEEDATEWLSDSQAESEYGEKPKCCCAAGSSGIKWYHMIQWLLFTIGVEISILVMILYWPWAIHTDRPNLLGSVNLHKHLVNGLVAIVEVWVSGTPVQLLHFIYLQIFGASYITFTGIYFAVNGTDQYGDTYIYDVIDYEEKPGISSAVVVIVIFVFVPLYHAVLYLGYVARRGLVKCVHNRLHICQNRKNYQELDEPHQQPYFS